MKRILLGCLVFVLFGFSHVQAQTPSVTLDNIDSIEGVETFGTPDMQISNISLDKQALSARDTVKVSFLAENLADVAIPNLYYKISLVGIDANGDEHVYDEKNEGSASFTSRESRYVGVWYELPDRILGTNLNIRVQAFLQDETQIASADVPVVISEQSVEPVSITKASVVALGKEFGLEDGPTVDKGSEVKLRLELSSVKAGNVLPYVEFASKKDPLNKVVSSTLDLIAVTGTKKIVDIVLPSLDKSDVYIGRVMLLDSGNRKQVSEILMFRYIVGGAQADIFSVESKSVSVKKNDSINLEVVYGGAPLDIVKGVSEQGNADLTVKIENERGDIVATEVKSIALRSVQDTVVFNLISNEDAQALKAVVSISKDGVVLATRETNITPDYDAIRKNAVDRSMFGMDDVIVLKIIGVILVLMIIIVVIIGSLSKRNAGAMMIILAGIFGATSIGAVSDVSAQNSIKPVLLKTYKSPTTFQVQLSSVSVPGSVAPGQPFNVSGKISYVICNNTASDPLIAVTLRKDDGDTNYVEKDDAVIAKRTFDPSGIGEQDNHDKVVRASSFTTKTKNKSFVAPQEPGNYLVVVSAAVKVYNHTYSAGPAQAWVRKVYRVTVTDNDMCPALPGIQVSPCPPGTPGVTHGGGDVNCTEDIWELTGGYENACKDIDASGNGKREALWKKTYDCPKANNNHGTVYGACRLNADGSVSSLCDFADPVTGVCLQPTITDFKGKPDPTTKERGCKLSWDVKNASSCTITRTYADGVLDQGDPNKFPNTFTPDPSGVGEYESGKIGGTATFTLNCSNGDTLKVSKDALCRLQYVQEN